MPKIRQNASYSFQSINCLPFCKRVSQHCLKSVQIRSFSDPYFPVFGLNTDIYGVNLGNFSPNLGKYGLEKTPYLDTFHAVQYTNTIAFEFNRNICLYYLNKIFN